MARPFLTAEWRKLAIANYAVDPEILKPFVPPNTELDFWDDQCYVSLVGFMFLETRLKGIKVPFHVNFEEVNLRFYVKYAENNEWKRGVVFIREIVPKPALALVANTLYGENYVTRRMNHEWSEESDYLSVTYRWREAGKHQIFRVKADKTPVEIAEGSKEEFITEHYWGYTTRSDGKRTDEYGVEHPRWQVYPVKEAQVRVDFGKVYGETFSMLNAVKPASVMLAEGSETLVREGTRIY